jgi:hypothetical protein
MINFNGGAVFSLLNGSNFGHHVGLSKKFVYSGIRMPSGNVFNRKINLAP